jgi:hypothetical protein
VNAETGDQLRGNLFAVLENCEVAKAQPGNVLARFVCNRNIENNKISINAKDIVVLLRLEISRPEKAQKNYSEENGQAATTR